MRVVFGSIRRVAATLVVAAVLCGPASVALAGEAQKSETLLTTIIVWLQSRMSVPGG